MDGDKFDDLSRSLATRVNRRDAFRTAGKGGLLASVAGAIGLSARGALAAPPTGPVDCTMPLLSRVATGKNKGKRYDGDLAITIETDGAIDTGTLTMADGNTYDVVGQTNGRSITLRIKLATDRFLALFGTAEQDVRLCAGRMDGSFGGWAESDLGTWTLGVKPSSTSGSGASGGSTTGGNSTAGGGSTTGGASGGGGTGNSSGGGTGNSGGGGGSNPEPTATPCPAQDCGVTFVWLPDQCACGCPPPSEKCGDTMCCPAGSVCDATGGSCSCPSGTELCGDSCVQSCASGSNLNFTTCQCETQTSCGSGETLCNGACVSIACSPDQLFDATQCMCVNRCPAGQGFCGGTCIDIVNDRNNCGLCGNVCQTGVPCIAGTCECPATTTYDPTKQKCV